MFAVPLVFFIAKKAVNKKMAKTLGGIFVLGGLQVSAFAFDFFSDSPLGWVGVVHGQIRFNFGGRRQAARLSVSPLRSSDHCVWNLRFAFLGSDGRIICTRGENVILEFSQFAGLVLWQTLTFLRPHNKFQAAPEVRSLLQPAFNVSLSPRCSKSCDR